MSSGSLYHTFKNPNELCFALALEMQQFLEEKADEGARCSLALSGGNTPKLLFEQLGSSTFREAINWSNTDLFWVDEKLVPTSHPESNFGSAQNLFLNYISINKRNLHKIRGEAEPEAEVDRYAEEICRVMNCTDGMLPKFDWVFLGVGQDGHIASIYKDMRFDYVKNNICGLISAPNNKARIITLTMDAILNASRITFLVTGSDKAEIVEAVLNNKKGTENLPASVISRKAKFAEWLIDERAALLL